MLGGSMLALSIGRGSVSLPASASATHSQWGSADPLRNVGKVVILNLLYLTCSLSDSRSASHRWSGLFPSL